MYDLIYAEDEYEKCKVAVKEAFPDVVIKDASDDIHRGQFSVEFDDKKRSQTDYRMGLIEYGLALCSLNFQLAKTEEIKELVKKWEAAGKPTKGPLFEKEQPV